MDSFAILVSVLAGLVTIIGGIVAVWRYLQSHRRRKILPVSSSHLSQLNAGGHYHEALKLSDQAISSNPDDALAYVNKGWALNGLREYQKALQVCEQAILLSLSNAVIRAAACRQKARALNALGDYQNALKVCNDAIRLQPQASGYAYYQKSVALNKLGRHTEALKVCDQALLLGPNDDELHALVAKQKASALKGLGRH